MTMRHIFAGLIVALLLSVSSLAAACDLSCSFPQAQADCHSAQMGTGDSMKADIQMGDMTMAGMAMPAMANAGPTDQQIISTLPQPEIHHGLIGAMGPCERQSCDQGATDSFKSTHTIAAHFHTILAVAHSPSVDGLQSVFYDARANFSAFRPDRRVPLNISLRI